jgi:hypothetical protein
MFLRLRFHNTGGCYNFLIVIYIGPAGFPYKGLGGSKWLLLWVYFLLIGVEEPGLNLYPTHSTMHR